MGLTHIHKRWVGHVIGPLKVVAGIDQSGATKMDTAPSIEASDNKYQPSLGTAHNSGRH